MVAIACSKHGIIRNPRKSSPRCPLCAREKWRKRRETMKHRATMGTGKAGAEYKRRRKRYLALGLLCEGGCGDVATEVHHRPGDEPGTREWLDRTRWTPLCKVCHARLEADLMTRAPDGTFSGKRQP